jgi:Uncharacterized protein with conserved CXXC pairs
MKCGKCGNNEAVLHYKSMVDGNMTELHLCRECANGEEFQVLFDMGGSFSQLFGDRFTNPFVHVTDTFAEPQGFFVPVYGFTSAFRAPYTGEKGVTEILRETSEDKIPTEVDPAISKRRELYALKYELNEAVKAEEFEAAAQLRDKIRNLEKAG